MHVTSVFVDTSALYALMVSGDCFHKAAVETLAQLERKDAALISSSFVLQETVTLLQARHGMATVRSFHADFQPLLDIRWIEATLYERALAALLASGSRQVSLTDWSSFEVMRSEALDTAFAFDPHFQRQGFTLLP
ncbi:MAG: type II toxin-antitoxin system VapC family toxin [Armatimonadetes bacterium]|nr:type II toxin-antitoxin system VapC family toxin [Armatimonadota bacterium]